MQQYTEERHTTFVRKWQVPYGKGNNKMVNMKAITVKYYDLPFAYKKLIAEEFGCSLVTVRKAMELTNPVVSELCDRVRKRAVEMGARINTKYKYIEA